VGVQIGWVVGQVPMEYSPSPRRTPCGGRQGGANRSGPRGDCRQGSEPDPIEGRPAKHLSPGNPCTSQLATAGLGVALLLHHGPPPS
jgi:hypothetical protein